MEKDWIYLENWPALVDFLARKIGYELLPDEFLAIHHGITLADAENEDWYEYKIEGDEVVKLWFAADPGTNVLWWRAGCSATLLSSLQIAAEIMQTYQLAGGPCWRPNEHIR